MTAKWEDPHDLSRASVEAMAGRSDRSVIVELSRCRWPLHSLDLAHIFPASDLEVTEGPIQVKRLNDGNWLVEDGRHRCIRALLAGQTHIEAVLLAV